MLARQSCKEIDDAHEGGYGVVGIGIRHAGE